MKEPQKLRFTPLDAWIFKHSTLHWLFPGRESAFRRPSSQWLDGRLAVSGPG
jgi:hypothetical protein